MPEVGSHLEGLKQLVDEHRLLSEQNQDLTRENSLLKTRIEAMTAHARAILALYSDAQVGEKRKLAEIFKQTVEELVICVRVYNCLKDSNIQTIGELVQKTEVEILGLKRMSRKGLNEIKQTLATQGLRLGMNEEDMLAWIPLNPESPLFRQ